jgi:hypothetical protein
MAGIGHAIHKGKLPIVGRKGENMKTKKTPPMVANPITTPWTNICNEIEALKKENLKLQKDKDTLFFMIQDYKTLIYDIEQTIKMHKQAHPHMDGCKTLLKR